MQLKKLRAKALRMADNWSASYADVLKLNEGLINLGEQSAAADESPVEWQEMQPLVDGLREANRDMRILLRIQALTLKYRNDESGSEPLDQLIERFFEARNLYEGRWLASECRREQIMAFISAVR